MSNVIARTLKLVLSMNICSYHCITKMVNICNANLFYKCSWKKFLMRICSHHEYHQEFLKIYNLLIHAFQIYAYNRRISKFELIVLGNVREKTGLRKHSVPPVRGDTSCLSGGKITSTDHPNQWFQTINQAPKLGLKLKT